MKIRTAFTLIELLVVIAIVGILSGLIVVSMSGVTNKANIAKSQIFSNSLRNLLMTNMISEWKLDGNTNDSWSGGNNGTWSGSGGGTNTSINYRPSSECVSGQCLNFDGTDDSLDCGNKAILQQMPYITLSVWINFSSISTSQSIYNKGGNNVAGTIWLYFNSPNSRLYFEVDRSAPYCSLTPTVGQWYHIAVTYDGADVNYYVNGSNVGTTNIGSKTINNSSYDAYIGRYAGSSYLFSGNMDDIRIFSVAISSSQIKEQYYAGLNKLLANGEINQREFIQKTNSLSLNN
jgi:prepilin-type N-terminal cleavage/methylation domain-containing protein